MGAATDPPTDGARGAAAARAPRDANGKTVRIGRALFERADRRAAPARRSVQKQIEYWAELGRLLDDGLAGADLHALLDGRKTIVRVALAATAAPDAATVLEELEADRATGTLAASVTSAPVVYDLDPDGRTLRRHDEGGVTEGTFVDGRFVER